MNERSLETAVILANGLFRTPFAKTAHGLVRGPCRYRVVGIIDDTCDVRTPVNCWTARDAAFRYSSR